MSWYRSTLSGAQVASGETGRCRTAFSAAFDAARAPRQMALFQAPREDGGCELYLTPDCGEHAAALLADWQAVPCERPSPRGLELLVGHNEMTYYLP